MMDEQVNSARERDERAEAKVGRMKKKIRKLSNDYHFAVEKEAWKHQQEVEDLKREQVDLEAERSSLRWKVATTEGERDKARKLLKLEGDASMAAEAKSKKAEEEAQLLRAELEPLRDRAQQMYVEQESLKAQLAHEAKVSKAQLDAALIEAQITTYGKVLDGQLSISQMRKLHRNAQEFLPRLQEVVTKLIADSLIPTPPTANEAGPSIQPKTDLPDDTGHPDAVDSTG